MPCVWGQQGAPRVALPAEMVSRAWASGNADAEEAKVDDEEGAFAPAPPVGYAEFVEAAPAPAGTDAEQSDAAQCEGGRVQLRD